MPTLPGMRQPKREPERRPVPAGRNPYLQAAAINACLAAAVVLVALATGGELLRSLLAVLIAFVLGTAYSWWRLRQRDAGGHGPGADT